MWWDWTFSCSGSTLDLLCSEVQTLPFMLRDLEVHAGPFMLRGPSWTFYAQGSTLDLLCSEPEGSMLYLFVRRCLCKAFYAKRSRLCSEVHTRPFMLRGPYWTFYAHWSTLNLLCSEEHASPFTLRSPGWKFYAQRSTLDLLRSKPQRSILDIFMCM